MVECPKEYYFFRASAGVGSILSKLVCLSQKRIVIHIYLFACLIWSYLKNTENKSSELTQGESWQDNYHKTAISRMGCGPLKVFFFPKTRAEVHWLSQRQHTHAPLLPRNAPPSSNRPQFSADLSKSETQYLLGRWRCWNCRRTTRKKGVGSPRWGGEERPSSYWVDTFRPDCVNIWTWDRIRRLLLWMPCRIQTSFRKSQLATRKSKLQVKYLCISVSLSSPCIAGRFWQGAQSVTECSPCHPPSWK